VLLQGGSTAATAAISQTGLIPSTVQTLVVDVGNGESVPFDIYIGNQSLVLTATNPNYTVYEANISAWAGQTEQLTISVPEYFGDCEFDDITFSQIAVSPEPSIVSLTVIGGLFFGARKWFVRR
jgi:hypothetical protein